MSPDEAPAIFEHEQQFQPFNSDLPGTTPSSLDKKVQLDCFMPVFDV